jgi:hypothetical protein
LEVRAIFCQIAYIQRSSDIGCDSFKNGRLERHATSAMDNVSYLSANLLQEQFLNATIWKSQITLNRLHRINPAPWQVGEAWRRDYSLQKFGF